MGWAFENYTREEMETLIISQTRVLNGIFEEVYGRRWFIRRKVIKNILRENMRIGLEIKVNVITRNLEQGNRELENEYRTLGLAHGEN